MDIRLKLELEVLASMLHIDACMLEGIKELKPCHFKNEKNAYLFEVIEQTYKKGLLPTASSLGIQNANMLKMSDFSNYIVFVENNLNYMPLSNFRSSYRVLKEYYISEICEQKSVELHSISANCQVKTETGTAGEQPPQGYI